MAATSFKSLIANLAAFFSMIALSGVLHGQTPSTTHSPSTGGTCVLTLDVTEGATVTVDDRDYGTRRELRFEKLVPGQTYQSKIRVKFAEGGEAQRIAFVQGGRRIVVAARAASRIVYAWKADDGSIGLRSIQPDGTRPAEIAVADESGNWVDPVISPDGSRIAVVRAVIGKGQRNHRELWTMRIDGDDRQKLIENFGTGVPSWAPDGKALLFTHVPGPNKAEIFTVDLHGRQRRLATDSFNPGFSPDATHIVFSRTVSLAGGRHRPDLYVMNADGTGQHRVRENSTFGQWSPLGRKILFEKPWNDVRVMNPDGSGEVQLFNDRPSMGKQPLWSPNGLQLASPRASKSKEMYSELYVMRLDGSESHRVDISEAMGRLLPGSLAGERREIGEFCWSPDGSQLALIWESSEAFLDGDQFGRLVVCNPDGTGIRILLPTSGRIEDLNWR